MTYQKAYDNMAYDNKLVKEAYFRGDLTIEEAEKIYSCISKKYCEEIRSVLISNRNDGKTTE